MKVTQVFFEHFLLPITPSSARAGHLRYGSHMHKPCHDLIRPIPKFQHAFVAWIRHPPVSITPYRRIKPLRRGILELQPLEFFHVWFVSVCYRRPGPMYVEPSLGHWTIETFFTVTCGDDDMGFTVHEAAGFVGAYFADGKDRFVR